MDKITSFCKCNSPLNWHNCYDKDSRYAKYFTPESNAHPAKMSWGLAERIFKHLKQLNLLKHDSTIIDFMAGTGRTNVMATLHGHRSIAIELEPHFCKMITDNKAQLEKVKMTDCDIEIIQADARNMSEILTDGGVGVVSPPYSNIEVGKGLNTLPPREGKNDQSGRNPSSPSQIATKYTDIVGVVSPPYQNAQDGGMTPARLGKKANGNSRGGFSVGEKYSENPSNIGNLPDKPLVGVVSPPYTQAREGGGLNKNPPESFRGVLKHHSFKEGDSEGQIGNLKDTPLVGITSPPYGDTEPVSHQKENAGPIGIKSRRKEGRKVIDIPIPTDKPLVGITSPPYEKSLSDGLREEDREKYQEWKRASRSCGKKYSSSIENIGNQQDESYLSAMLQVYSQAYNSGISPLVVVTKNPTRNGKLRRLDLDTVDLLQLAGYKIIDYHRAILFKERNQMTLDGNMKKIAKGRLSFFKRLSYDKGGKVARWEDVIFAQKEEFIWKQ